MALGVVYTPREVAAPMVQMVLAPLVLGRDADAVAALRICDFAVGDGVFLVEVVAYLAPIIGRDRAIACVVGVDIDARAIERARRVLPRADLRVANALTHAWGETFDVVVGNPPYIRQELVVAEKAALRAFDVYDGVADLYVYFIELAHRIARRYCLIVPNKWMTAHYARPLRAFLAKARGLEGLVDLRAEVFDGADAFPCILWGMSTASPACAIDTRWTAEPWHVDRADDRALIERLELAHPPLRDVVDRRPMRGVVTGLNEAFVIDHATRDAIDSDLARPFVKGRDIRRFDIAPIDRWILMIEHGTVFDELPAAVRDHLVRFRPALEARKPGRYAWFELQDPIGPLVKTRAPRLLYQDIQTQPACALDAGDLVPDTTVWMLPTDDRVVLAILNSSLYGWYARRRFPPALNGAVRPKADYIGRLPIALVSPSLRAAIETLDVNDRARLDALVFDAYGLSRDERRCVSDGSRGS